MPLDDLYNKLVAIREFDIERETIAILNENAELLQNLIKRQLGKGKDGEGNLLNAKYGPHYTDATVREKELYGTGLGAETNFVTYYMSGNIYRSLFLKTQGNTFLFDSYEEYFDTLLKYSPHAFELNAENLAYFSNEILIPQLQIRFNRHFNGV